MAYEFDLGAHRRPVTTHSPDAQLWVDRGLNWLYGFNQEEAALCFRRAGEIDPGCAMAHWGDAYASGPFYNLLWDWMTEEERGRTLAHCRRALARAEAAASRASPAEHALINALKTRYPDGHPEAGLLQTATHAYADAMRAVYARFPDDLDIVALFAEALMMRTPWALWDIAHGVPQPEAATPEILAILERAIDQAGERPHLAINHLYIHAVEMGPGPETALRQADQLAGLAPDLGHMEHMGAHIFSLCGAYERAIEASWRAISADTKFLAERGTGSFYTTACCHDLHMLMFAAMMSGRERPARWAADRIREIITPQLLDTPRRHMRTTLDGYWAKKLHMLVRFGRWHDILQDPLPADPELQPVSLAMRAYARGIAQAALGDVAEAARERRAFDRARSRLGDSVFLFNNPVQAILDVGEAMLAGELAYRRGAYPDAFRQLRTAVARSDALSYSEPWPWMHPPRHALGALLLEQDQLAEAEAIYRGDLGYDAAVPRCRRHPDNIWALHGLHECLQRRGSEAETMMISQRLAFAQARADRPITASCLCRGGPLAQSSTDRAPRPA
ncbi:MAG: hypothetical protein ACFBRM_01440 [Pikeienuella sp.]